MSTSTLERYGDSGMAYPRAALAEGMIGLQRIRVTVDIALDMRVSECSNQSASINTSCVWLGFNVCQVSPDDKILNGNPSDLESIDEGANAFSDRGLLVNSRASSSPSTHVAAPDRLASSRRLPTRLRGISSRRWTSPGTTSPPYGSPPSGSTARDSTPERSTLQMSSSGHQR